MRKLFFSILALVMAMPLLAKETTTELVTETYTCGDSWASGYKQINKSLLTDLTAGDKIQVEVTAVSATDTYPCVYLQYVSAGWASWEDFANTEPRSVSLTSGQEVPYTAEFTLTETMVESILAGEALIVKGSGYTADKITFIHYSADTEETALWEGEQVFGNGWSEWIKLDKSYFADATAGSTLKIHVTAIDTTADSQGISLQNGSWANFATSLSYWFWNPTLPMDVEFELTAETLAEIQSTGGLIVKGINFTATKVTLETPVVETDVIWSGSCDMTSGWGNWQTIAAKKFANAKSGDIIRLMTSNVGSAAQAQLSSTSWTSLASKSFGGKYVDFTITDALLTELQANGVIVNGCYYELTAVRLIDPSTIVTYTSSINIEQADWTWTDTKPVIGLKITNPSAAAATIPVEIDVTTDKGVAVKTYSQYVELAASEENHEVNFTLDDITDPGIYRFTAYVNDDIVSYTRPEDNAYTWTTLNIAYKPTEIVSAADAQSDFASYWAGVKTQLKAIPVGAELTLVEEGTYRNLYKVTLNSVPNGTSGDPIQIRGYYAEVKADGQYPTIINFMGYDSDDTSTLWHPGADDRQNYNELIISPRGQSFGNRGDYKTDNIYCNTTAEATDDNIASGKWFTYHFGDKDSYYYRGAYMDQVRAIDFVYTRDKVEKKNIFLTGGSQGGAFTLVAAALSDNPVTAIAPAIQFMGDFPDYFQVGSWPVSEAKNAASWKSMNEEEMYKFLSYYDTKNFASMITAPTMSSIGLQDNVCPAHTNLAPFNLLTCEKQLYINKNLVHETPSNNAWSTPNNTERDWSALCNEWWTAHTKTVETVRPNASCEGYVAYYNSTSTGQQAPEGYIVYTATKNDASIIILSPVADRIIPAGKAVIIKGETTANFDLTATSEETASATLYTANQFKGVASRTLVSTLTSNEYVYVLGNTTTEGTKFYRYAATSYLPAGKCYLDLGSESAKAVTFCVDEESTAISNVENVGDSRQHSAYNMLGQRVGANAKGMVIVNGRKIINK